MIGFKQKNLFLFFFIFFLSKKKHSFWYFIYPWQSSGKGNGRFLEEKRKKQYSREIAQKRFVNELLLQQLASVSF